MAGNQNSGGPRPKVRDDDKRGAVKGNTAGFGNAGSIGQAAHVRSEKTAAEIQELAEILTIDQIAEEVALSVTTIWRHYGAEFRAGRRGVTKAVASKLISMALAGDKASMIFYLKTQGGWSQKVEVSGPNGGPIKTQTFDFTAFLEGKTEDEIAAIIPLLEQLVAFGGEDIQGGGEGGLGAGEGETSSIDDESDT